MVVGRRKQSDVVLLEEMSESIYVALYVTRPPGGTIIEEPVTITRSYEEAAKALDAHKAFLKPVPEVLRLCIVELTMGSYITEGFLNTGLLKYDCWISATMDDPSNDAQSFKPKETHSIMWDSLYTGAPRFKPEMVRLRKKPTGRMPESSG